LYKDSLTTEPFTGHYEGEVMKKKIEYDVVDGRRNGIFVIYNENGNVETIGYMKDEKNYGEWKYYYPNGVLESIGIFKDDMADSVWNWYYMTGTVKQTGEFSEGKKNGEWKYYDDFGNHYLTMKYKNDEVKDSIVYEIPVLNESADEDTSVEDHD
jgi:antitoxin component YwqK of YwqJK toxin-antitoxin module